MGELSERALRLYGQAEKWSNYPGLSAHAVAALFHPTRLAEIARIGIEESGAPQSPALLDFGIRYGRRGYAVRGDPPYRTIGILEDWRRIGGPQGIESARGWKTERGWRVLCFEAYPGRGNPMPDIYQLAIGEDGTIYLPPDADSEIVLASSFDRWLEYEAVLDELGGNGRWTRRRLAGADGVARSLAEALGLVPLPEASDAFVGAWQSETTTIRTRPAPEGRLVEIYTRGAGESDVRDALARLGLAVDTTSWPAA